MIKDFHVGDRFLGLGSNTHLVCERVEPPGTYERKSSNGYPYQETAKDAIVYFREEETGKTGLVSLTAAKHLLLQKI